MPIELPILIWISQQLLGDYGMLKRELIMLMPLVKTKVLHSSKDVWKKIWPMEGPMDW